MNERNFQIPSTDRIDAFLAQETTPLQKAALSAINRFKKELAEYGLTVRSGMELEFVTKTEDGKPASRAVHHKNLKRYLNGQLFPTTSPDQTCIQAIEYESVCGNTVIDPHHHEIKIGWPKLSKVHIAPEKVAGTTAFLKQYALQDALKQSTCLTTPGNVVPDFSTRPHYNQYDLVVDETMTSGLHVNVSLYDKGNCNLLALSPNLKRHCADALAEIQNDATLGFLPYIESMRRIRANDVTPRGVGFRNSESKYSETAHDYISLRMMIDRIENRLPGADSDPLVAMAVTMAALVKAVKRNTKLNHGTLEIDDHPMDDPIAMHIPFQHRNVVEKFKAAQHMKQVLGKELYDAILHEYGKDTTAPHYHA